MKISWEAIEIDVGYCLEIDVQFAEKLRDFHNDLPFLTEKMNIEKRLKACYQFTW